MIVKVKLKTRKYSIMVIQMKHRKQMSLFKDVTDQEFA